MPHTLLTYTRRALATAAIALAGVAPTIASAQSLQPYAAAPQTAQPYAGYDERAYALPSDPYAAQQQGGASTHFTATQVLEAGHQFFGATSGSLGGLVERVFSRYGLPNGYILGEEASGAFFGGLTYGEGTLHTRNAGSHRVFWQGPSLGFDWGAQGSRTMILVYDLPHIDAALGRFGGVAGEVYAVGGLGARVLHKHGVTMVPIRTGVGARIGVNLNYLKFTPRPTWNPL